MTKKSRLMRGLTIEDIATLIENILDRYNFKRDYAICQLLRAGGRNIPNTSPKALRESLRTLLINSAMDLSTKRRGK